MSDINNAVRILVADDEDRIRKLICDFLAKEGYEVLEAADGGQALNMTLGQPKPDIVILDVMMPVMDGWMVLGEIRKTTDIPVILLTAKSSESDQLSGFRLGADDYITKPFSPSLLVARVQALLRRRGAIGGRCAQCGDVYIDDLQFLR